MIDNTLYKKITIPLENVVKTCRQLEQSEDLVSLEKTLNNPVSQQLTTKLEKMRGSSEMIIYKFKDMRDWSMLNRGIFNKNEDLFNLEEKLDQVKRLTI